MIDNISLEFQRSVDNFYNMNKPLLADIASVGLITNNMIKSGFGQTINSIGVTDTTYSNTIPHGLRRSEIGISTISSSDGVLYNDSSISTFKEENKLVKPDYSFNDLIEKQNVLSILTDVL